jgi:hypothetical protein
MSSTRAVAGAKGGAREQLLLSGAKRTRAEDWGILASETNVFSGRALQEVFIDLVAAVLHQCIRPSVGEHVVLPGHHGFQRACDLISGLASTGGRLGHQCSHAPGRPIPSRLILLQTSVG